MRHLPCFALLAGHDVTILNQSEPDTTRLAALLEGMEALVLTRERTRIDEQLLIQLPTLKLISQTGKASQHIDPALCQQYGVAVAEGIGSPIAPAELCWALIMAASRHIPAYSQALSQGNGSNLVTSFGTHAAWADARYLGLRQDRPADRPLWQGIWHVGTDMGQ